MRRITERPARRQGPGFAPEFLEERVLLSHGKPAVAAEISASAVATKGVTAITGSIVGLLATDALFTPTPRGFAGFSGHGASRPTGAVFLGFQHQGTASTTVPNELVLSQGSGVLTTIFGEQVNFNYTGTSDLKNAHTRTLALTGTVNSGTGEFDGDTGTFTATGLAHTNGRFNLSFSIKLTPPA